MWAARGPFLTAVVMVVAVVTPVVFVLRLLKGAIKILKLVVCKQKFHFITIILKHNTIHVTLIVAWPEPESWTAGSLFSFPPHQFPVHSYEPYAI
jgi:hypothetical protein